MLDERVPVRQRLVEDMHVLREQPVAQVALQVALVRRGHELLQDAGTAGAAEQAVVVLGQVVAEHRDLLHAGLVI